MDEPRRNTAVNAAISLKILEKTAANVVGLGAAGPGDKSQQGSLCLGNRPLALMFALKRRRTFKSKTDSGAVLFWRMMSSLDLRLRF